MIRFVQAKKEGECLYIGEKAYSSIFNPIKEAERIWQNFCQNNKKNVIFLGGAPFYPILHALKEEKNVFVIDAYLSEMLDQNDFFKRLNKNLKFSLSSLAITIFKNSHHFTNYFSNQDQGNFLKDCFFIPSPYEGEENIKTMQSGILDFFSNFSKLYTTNTYFDLIWDFNFLKQVKRKQKICFTNDLVFKSKNCHKAILVSSGLSTEEHLSLIKKWSAEAFVFSLPGIYPLLKQYKIPVDFLISSDGGYYNGVHFSRIKETSIPLIVPFSIYEGITRRFENTFYFIDLEEHYEVLKQCLHINESLLIPMNGTVINSAFTVLKNLGFQEVMLFGIDFKISPFKYHSLSNTTEEMYFNFCHKLTPFETLMDKTILLEKNDNKTYTDHKLALYEKLFKETQTACHLKILEFDYLTKSKPQKKSKAWSHLSKGQFIDRLKFKKTYLKLKKKSILNNQREDYFRKRLEKILKNF